MKFIKTFILSMLIILLLTAVCEAKARGIIFAFDKDHPPFSFLKDGEPAGFDIDILTHIFVNCKYGFTPKVYKWEDGLNSLRKGIKVQLMSQMNKTEDRLLVYDFSEEPYLIDEVMIFSKNDTISSIQDLFDKRVAVQKGSSYKQMLEDYEKVIILPTDSEYDALEALENDLVDAFIGPKSVAQYIINSKDYTDICAVGESLETSYMYLAVEKGDTELLDFINAGMKRLRETGQYQQIHDKWFGYNNTEEDSCGGKS
ncbi:MAG TPA: amino acid ABC transporter substrate-binding protein [Candidatus Cloacimonetes bacterium]|nr:amino acid ABC transporter substrate-binding protein [Candidatus Cloacimonadota bacterium]HEX37782.1 amino acid ABC transporter substrate-binding protein [Candidatus Cloacimonadota bacterium]